MKFEDLDLNQLYTYADYFSWTFQERVELIRGKIFMLSAPNLFHQDLSSNLHRDISNYLMGKPCKVYTAPFDVRLPLPPSQRSDDKITTVVQPDISVICDTSKLDKRGCIGPPEWLIEVLSPSSKKYDTQKKFELYESAGVQEYWIFYPIEQRLLTYQLNVDGKYGPAQHYGLDDEVSSLVLPQLVIVLSDIFPFQDMVREGRIVYSAEENDHIILPQKAS